MNRIYFKTKAWGLALLISSSLTTLKAQQPREVGDFTGLVAGDPLKIILSQSDLATVKVDAPEAVQSSIKTEVKDGILSVFTDGNFPNDQNITILITVKSLNSLENSGVAEIKSENKLICENLKIVSTGVGNIDLDLDAKEITSILSGAGHINLKGSTQLLNATITGAGGLKATELEANKVVANVSGAGDAKVNVSQSLNADVSGAGSVIYKGTPVDRVVNISGVGSVRESKTGTGEETASDTTKVKWGKKKITIVDDNEDEDEDDEDDDSEAHNHRPKRNNFGNFKYWRGIDIGVNGYLNSKASLNPPPGADFLELNYAKSIQVGLNAFQKNFHLIKNYFNIYTGLGINFNHYALENNVTLRSDTPYLKASVDSAIHYKKNKLNVTYLKLPLMLEVNTSKNPNHNFHIAVGGELLYRIYAVTKQAYELNGKQIQIKQKDHYHLEPFIFNLMARVGYNHMSFYASYGITRLFKFDQAPQVYPFAAGITIAI
jgi:hypothetical protein